MVAPGPVPEKMARKGSVPPGKMVAPWAFTPPPKPHVCKVIVAEKARVNVVSKTSVEPVSVPVYDTLFAKATGARASSNGAPNLKKEVLENCIGLSLR